MNKGFSFTSERLRYRGIDACDADNIIRWRSNPNNYRYFFVARPLSLEEHMAWYESYLNDTTRFDFIIEEVGGIPVGTCGLSNITSNSCEIMYMIGEETARGKGYASEAVKALTEIAFRELGVAYIDAKILAGNAASEKVALAGGYTEYMRVYRVENPSA